MTLGLVILLAIVVRAATGLPLRGIGQIPLRAQGLFLFALALVAALPAAAGALHIPRSLVTPVWLAVMALLLVLCIVNASSTHGFAIMAVGVALNLVVIAANCVMPVSLRAAEIAGGPAAVSAVLTGDMFHVPMRPSTAFAVLGDTVPLPGPRGFRSILSVGDMLMFVGVLTVIASFAPKRPWRSAPRGFVGTETSEGESGQRGW